LERNPQLTLFIKINRFSGLIAELEKTDDQAD
jgi:hypothetical protein